MTLREKVALVLTTVDSPTTASHLADILFSERLAACVSHFPVHSAYHWKGALEESTEIQLMIKTSPTRVRELTARLTNVHPYETPEILILDSLEASAAYSAWVIGCTVSEI